MEFKGDKKNREVSNSCMVCGSFFGPGATVLVSGDEKRSLFHITCEKCFSSSLLLTLYEEKGIVNMGLATDLERNEAKEKIFGDPISADEVIDAHKMISSFKGDAGDFLKRNLRV